MSFPSEKVKTNLPLAAPIHPEKGPTLASNGRLLWQLELGQNFPDIFPEVIIPATTWNDNQDSPEDISTVVLPTTTWDYYHSFPVAKIDGTDWHNLLEKPLPLSVHLTIARTTAQQIWRVFQQTGIIVEDRHSQNIRLDVGNPNTVDWSHISPSQVKQIDLEAGYIYDAVTDKYTANPPSLAARIQQYHGHFNLAEAKNPAHCADKWRIALLVTLRYLFIAVGYYGARSGQTDAILLTNERRWEKMYADRVKAAANIADITQAFMDVCQDIEDTYPTN